MPLLPAAIAARPGPGPRALALMLALALAAASAQAAEPPTPAPTPTPGSPLDSGLDTILEHFIQPLSRDQLETKALAALVEKLDPYSHYLDAAEMDLFRSDLDASFGGIGVNLDFKDSSGYPRITYLLYGGVAGAAGIRRGDLLLAVAGKDIKGQSYEQVSGALRGALGTPVTVRLRREGEAAPLDFTLKRVMIEMPSVRALRRDATGKPDWWLDRKRKLGYARIASLATDTAPTIDRAVAELKRGGLRGLVLDLRDCSGGLMQGALDTADLFVARGRLLTIRQRGEDQTYDAKPGKYTRLPLVLLINGGTVSSGEILAGALADNRRGTLVGERTFGKGRIQVIYSLGEGRGGMVLSTGTFQRPNGKTIDVHDVPEGSTEAGIAPEIEVKMSEAEHTAWLEFAEKTTGTLVLTPEEQLGAPPDPVLAKAIELLSK